MSDLTAAQEAIDDFAARFGAEARAYLDLARHAALPLALTPDLLYLLWFDFRTDEQGDPLQIPWVAVADLLLSHLCREISHETYALDDGVRDLLLQQLVQDGRFGMARVRRLAAFLDQYAERQLHNENPYTQEAGQAQRLTAYAYANPQQLVDYLARLYEKPLPDSQIIRYATLMETLQAPLTEWDHVDEPTRQTFAEAQTVGRSLAAWARGDVDAETAVSHLRAQFGRGVTIGETAVALPEEMAQALGAETAGEGMATAADLLAFFDDFLDRIMVDVSSRLAAAQQAIGAWQQDPSRAPLLLITGRRGSGKTNLIVNFLKQRRQGSTAYGLSPQTVNAYHFCMAERPQTLDARLFVRSLAQQLTANLPGFRDPLPVETLDDPDEPWDAWVRRQLIWPLQSLSGPTMKGSAQQMSTPTARDVLLIVDGIDAATSGTERILDVCLQLLDELPNARLLLTSEMSTAVRDALANHTYATYTLDIVYQNFDLRIRDARTKSPAREVTVLASPAGESPSPVVIREDDGLVQQINRVFAHVTPETPRQSIGIDLFRAFITRQTEDLFYASMKQVRQTGERLRLRLFLGGHDYVSLPWEWLYEKDFGFWAQQPDVSLVRYRQQTAVFRTRANPQPLNVLFISAAPAAERPFPVAEISDALTALIDTTSGRIQLSIMQNATRRQLRETLANKIPHILHVAAIVHIVEQQPMLLLADESGRAERLVAKDLAVLVRDTELALIVLSAVHEDQWTAVLRLADELTEVGIPAVAALPALLPAHVMAQGAAMLLDRLADGEWLDTAVAAARQAMAAQRDESEGVDWALFTSTPHGNIWRSEITAVDLYEALTDGFTLADLEMLCFDLNVKFEDLTGDGRRGKMVSLVRDFQRRDQLQTLAMAMLDARPNTDFVYRRREAIDETAVPADLLNPQTLQRVLNEQFNLEEIRILCLDLAVDFETLPGDTKASKAQELIVHHQRQQELPQLASAILRQRPSLREQFRAPPQESVASQVDIYRTLVDLFSLAELSELMFELGINEEDLGGTTRTAKVRELVLWMQRHNQLPELIALVERERPSVDWRHLREETPAATAPAESLSGDYPPEAKGFSPPLLARAIEQYYDFEELKTLCFEMGVDFDNLAGDSTSEKSRELVRTIANEGRLNPLMQLLRRDRPTVDWGRFGEAS